MRTRVYITLALIFSLFLAPIAKADPRLKLQLDPNLNCNTVLLEEQGDLELTNNSFALILGDFLNNQKALWIVLSANEYISRNLNPLDNIKLRSLDINTFLKDKYPFIKNKQIRWTSEQLEILNEVESILLEFNMEMEYFFKNNVDLKFFVECISPTLMKLAKLIDHAYDIGKVRRTKLTPQLKASLNGFNISPNSCSSQESLH